MERRSYDIDLTINTQKITKVVIDPHYEEKHGSSINDGIILKLVKALDGREFLPVTLNTTSKTKLNWRSKRLPERLMAFPSRKKIKEMADKLDKVEGTLHLNDDATPLERFRWEICQKFLKYKRQNDLKQREIAEQLNVDEAIVSKIFHHRIEKISTDKLIEYAQIIDPDLKLRVS